MAKKRRVRPADRLKSTMVNAFQLWRPFVKEFEEQLHTIQEKSIELAEMTAGQENIAENLKQLADDLLTSAQSLEALVQKQSDSVTELGVSTMKLKEIEGDPAEIGELIIDATTIIANWDTLIQYDVDLLVQSLQVVLPPSRLEALKRLPKPLLEAWHVDVAAALKATEEQED